MDVARVRDDATTPKARQTYFQSPALAFEGDDQSHMTTPTRDTFQMPLSTTSYPSLHSTMAPPSLGSPRMHDISSQTRHMHPAAEVGISEDGMDVEEAEGSEDESTLGDDGGSQKKKKGQRFFCTDYPPCSLSFTRSEHLARHIRKHTGERPFQCHCLRRFSRLDNLRQHAQTVHQNEDIPLDSLAATGTRFQRQIRTDRVKTPSARVRTSTLNSNSSGPYHKGHSRNLSSSSVGSVSSEYSVSDDPRGSQPFRRPMPLNMAHMSPSRNSLHIDTYGGMVQAGQQDQPFYSYFPPGSNGYGPSQQVYSVNPNSPGTHAGLQSPIAMAHDGRGMTWAEPMHVRRMSFPASAGYQGPAPYAPNASPYPHQIAPQHTSSYANSSSMMTSPSASTFSSEAHQEHTAPEIDTRRRTWHPGSYGAYGHRPATSGLSYYQTPDSPKPMPSTQSAAAQNVRLPGIDSFIDRVNHKRISSSSYNRPASPMELDTPSPHQLAENRPPEQQSRHMVPSRSMHVASRSAPQSLETAVREMNVIPSSGLVTPRSQKREAWYNGPLSGPRDAHVQQNYLRTSPGGSSAGDGPPTPSTMSGDYQPAILHSNGFVEQIPQPHTRDEFTKIRDNMIESSIPGSASDEPFSVRRNGDMDRLDALVAVATSEQSDPRHQ